MYKAIRTLLYAIFLSALIAIGGPLVQLSLYSLHLASLPAPVRLALPVENVPAGALRDSWHARRDGNRRHEGVDIFAARGTPVRATTEGIVMRVGSNRLGGQVVWVLGPGGQRHYYAHLDRFADISIGQRIQPGTRLGYVGNTGNARTTPPHLHYGIYARSGPVNPFPLFHRESF
jgi:murein DD-endopeptidase MepM/ murein hydrolase activator NlpD